MEITIGDFHRKYGLANTLALASVLYENHPTRKKDWMVFLKMVAGRVVEIPEISELLPLMNKVNRMVKHPSCPNPIRNRFYVKKFKVLKYLYVRGRVDYVIESDNLYNFVIGDYQFHQKKDAWENIILKSSIKGTEVYSPVKSDVEFSRDLYNQFCITEITMMAMKITI